MVGTTARRAVVSPGLLGARRCGSPGPLLACRARRCGGMGVIDTMRGAVELARKLDNIDMLRQLLAVQQEAAALFEENVALKAQLRERDERERLQADLVF